MMLGAGKPRLRLNDTISLRDDRRCASKPPTKRACKACAAAGPLPHLEDWIDENKLDKARILFAAAREFAGALGRLHIWQAQRQAGHTQGRRRLAVSLPNRGSRLRAP